MTGIHDWAEEGASPEELALLSASRREQPRAAARDRTLAALGLGTVLTATTSTSIAAATTIGGATLKLVAKVGLAVIVAGSASGLAWHATRRPVAVAARAPVAHVAGTTPGSPPQETAVAPASIAAAPAVEEPASIAPQAAPARAVHARPASSSDTLAQQVAALEKAQTALAARDPDAALRALDRYRARFPDGALQSEEKMLRVKATLARGDKNRAAALADELRQTDPDSPYARRVGDLVSGDKATKH